MRTGQAKVEVGPVPRPAGMHLLQFLDLIDADNDDGGGGDDDDA